MCIGCNYVCIRAHVLMVKGLRLCAPAHSLTYTPTDAHTHSLTHPHPLGHSPIYSLTYSLTHTLTQSLTCSLPNPLTLLLPPSLTHNSASATRSSLRFCFNAGYKPTLILTRTPTPTLALTLTLTLTLTFTIALTCRRVTVLGHHQRWTSLGPRREH